MTHFLNIVLNPYYLSGSKGKRFCLYHLPQNKNTPVFLFLPSFAEELNRCRVMVAMQARRFVEKGYGCLLLDYYGTGDSEGDFAETHWQQWREDVLDAYAWLAEQGYQHVILWGMRVGCLLALELAQESPQQFKRLLLWQPVIDGQMFMTQFLRLRIAMLMNRNQPKETTTQMRTHLQKGNSLEVAGYMINPSLVKALDGKNLIQYFLPEASIDWFEAIMEGEIANMASATQKAIDVWSKQVKSINTHFYQGPCFWQLHERALAPDLIEKTTLLFEPLRS